MKRVLIAGTDQSDILSLNAYGISYKVYGLGGDDQIQTSRFTTRNLIYGGDGQDHVWVGGANTVVYGGDGDDTVTGGRGHAQPCTLFCEAGADVLTGGFASDSLYGGAGNDTIFSATAHASTGVDQLDGGDGDDALFFLDNFGWADGGAGVDVLTITMTSLVQYSPISLVMHGTEGLWMDRYAISGIERLNLIFGLGDDTVTTGDGNDRINVSLGRNQVAAGGGDDWVTYAGNHANMLDGGAGSDTLAVGLYANQSFVVADGVATDSLGSTITNFEHYVVRTSEDASYGVKVVLGDGGDRFLGNYGEDTASGGAGCDILWGNGGNDSLQGDDGNDFVAGGDSYDWLEGGAGRDTLVGGQGSDTMTGGAGADRCRFVAADPDWAHLTDHDVITDFESGPDKLVFFRSVLGMGDDISPLTPGFLAIHGPDAAHGQFVFYDAGSAHPSELCWDADGTGFGDGVVIAVLTGVTSLTVNDFLLFWGGLRG